MRTSRLKKYYNYGKSKDTDRKSITLIVKIENEGRILDDSSRGTGFVFTLGRLSLRGGPLEGINGSIFYLQWENILHYIGYINTTRSNTSCCLYVYQKICIFNNQHHDYVCVCKICIDCTCS